jgi:hypothetical protein
MNACYGGHAELVAFLIGHGADVDVLAPTAHRYRPLHRTVEFKKTAPKTAGHGETVRQLLAHGADPMLRGSYYLVDAVTVAAMGCTEYVPMLLEHVAGDLDLYTACAIADHERVARILAESPEAATQADADSRDGSWLPLQYCARCKAGSDEDRLTTATLLRLVVEIKGFRREDAKEKKATMETYWVPGVNRLGAFGRWAFAEFTDVYTILDDFRAAVGTQARAQFDERIEGLLEDTRKDAATWLAAAGGSEPELEYVARRRSEPSE